MAAEGKDDGLEEDDKLPCLAAEFYPPQSISLLLISASFGHGSVAKRQ